MRLPAFLDETAGKEMPMRGLLLWLIVGVPLPIVILLYVFGYI